MRLGLALSISTPFAGAAAPVDPTTLAMTGYWRANFAGPGWTGTASAGVSGGRNLVDTGNPPATGAAQNGLTPADFDGTNDQIRIALTLDAFVNANAGSFFVLFRADTAAADAPALQPYANPCFASLNGSGFFVAGYSTAGFRCAIYDGSYKEIAVPASTGVDHLAQMKWDGSTLKARVNGGPWSSVAAGPIGSLIDTPVFVGTNYLQSLFFDGRILEIGFADFAVSDATFDGILAYARARYALSL